MSMDGHEINLRLSKVIKKSSVPCRAIKTSLFILMILLQGLISLPMRARAEGNAVTLVSFDAVSQPGQVKLVWVTATELDNSGFYWHRSTSPSTNPADASTRIPVYQPLFMDTQDFIQSQGDGSTGYNYEVYDRGVQGGTTYYYWIESLSLSGTSAYDGPVSALPSPGQNGTAGPSSTASLTPSATITTNPAVTSTSTPSSTPTGSKTPGPTATSTRTVTPIVNTATSNPYPNPNSSPTPNSYPNPNPTAIPTYTPYYYASATTAPALVNTYSPLLLTPGTEVLTGTVSPSSTPTLAPLPSIALLFPLVTDTGTPTLINAAASSQTQSKSGDPFGNSGITPGIILLILVIIIIWFLLGFFLYSYIRRLETRP
jgi:hypothetical protein